MVVFCGGGLRLYVLHVSIGDHHLGKTILTLCSRCQWYHYPVPPSCAADAAMPPDWTVLELADWRSEGRNGGRHA